MNPPRCHAPAYIDFLLGSQKVFSALEAARVQPDRPHAPAHDAFTRLLHRLEPDPQTLWQEVAPLLRKDDGVLVLDDSTLDKPYARAIEPVTRHWSGKHRAVVWGINLISLVWTDGDRMYPVDYRLYEKETDPTHKTTTKNEYARVMLRTAQERGLQPRCVLFDSWYSSLDNLKQVRDLGWTFLCPLKANRLVNPDRTKNRPLSECLLAASGTVVHLQGFGLVKVFRIIARDGDTEYWAANDVAMTELQRLTYAEKAWTIEEYYRGLKQHCGVERSQLRASRGQRNHIALALRAFVRLEYHRFSTGVSWFEAKTRIFREAVRHYLAHPLYQLP